MLVLVEFLSPKILENIVSATLSALLAHPPYETSPEKTVVQMVVLPPHNPAARRRFGNPNGPYYPPPNNGGEAYHVHHGPPSSPRFLSQQSALLLLAGMGLGYLVATNVGNYPPSRDVGLDVIVKNLEQNPAESLQVDSREEATEISIGRSLLDDPETKSEAHLIACVNGAPLRRILVREHLGIAKATAEDFFARFLPRMSEKHIVLDIGANTGQFAVPLASLGHTVISFEPSQSTCDVLRKNLENANVANQVEVHCAPAAKIVETLLFHADPVSSASGLISREEAEVLKRSGRGSEVTMKTSVTVDLSVGDRDVFLLKTDTQGYEMSVLEGATQVLKKGNVKFLLIEFSYNLLNNAGTRHIDLINYI